jgi:Cdc6-like AAA superfamily ATPase
MPKPENIVPHKFKKGQSGNPKGRPKLPKLKDAIALILAEEKDGKTALDAILAALRAKAAKGDVRAAQELLDRAYGKAQQKVDHTTKGEAINVISLGSGVMPNEPND